MIQAFDIAGYCRISVDEELDRDNVSIENQKAIIQDFVKQSFPAAPSPSTRTGTAPATPSSSGRVTRPCGRASCPTSMTSWW